MIQSSRLRNASTLPAACVVLFLWPSLFYSHVFPCNLRDTVISACRSGFQIEIPSILSGHISSTDRFALQGRKPNLLILARGGFLKPLLLGTNTQNGRPKHKMDRTSLANTWMTGWMYKTGRGSYHKLPQCDMNGHLLGQANQARSYVTKHDESQIPKNMPSANPTGFASADSGKNWF